MDEPRRIPIHRSLNRPHLLIGGERTLVQFAGLIAVLIVISGMSFFAVACGVTFWLVCIWALVRMGKADPQMSDVYRRHIQYKSYYSARTGAEALPAVVRTWKA
ncbi:MAG: VirB3 family type IV secretion system protein [Ralstonia sp.]|nr:VirB3 family type IV secretion system protein [Ralstonia sp.]